MKLSEGAQRVKIFLCHVIGHQRTSTAEEVLSNQLNKMTHRCQSLPGHPSARSVGLCTKWPGWQEWRLEVGSVHLDFPSPTLT